ncbi:MAG: phosphoenolpyruvate--protein phosphotransferase, partial [Proteobacteria bacterium]|nr:phosphoenolpyruvate--protein phosphotransferase [Pseudomonadota bacterium]
EAADSLNKDGIDFDADIEIGIMIEVPSAAILADVMATEVDFFSVGTNDLIQFSLAVDRVNKHVAHLYQPLHPAIIRMIKHVADAAEAAGIKIFMCGEMAGDPINIPILLGLGIKRLSMNPQSIPVIKRAIRSLSVEDARPFVKKILKATSVKDVVALVQEAYGNILPEKYYTE